MFLLVLLFALIGLPAQAAGLQLQPTEIKVDVYEQAVQTKLTVSNPAKEIQLFEIYADDAVETIDINPQTFTLESGARKEILITIKPTKTPAITHTNLSVISHPFAIENFAINSAAKVPLTIRQMENKAQAPTQPLFDLKYLLALIILGLIIYIIILQLKNKKLNKPL